MFMAFLKYFRMFLALRGESDNFVFNRQMEKRMLYICMMGLNTASLYALCPRQKVESI